MPGSGISHPEAQDWVTQSDSGAPSLSQNWETAVHSCFEVSLWVERDLVGSLRSVPRLEALEPSPLLEAPSQSTSLLLFIYCATYRCITSIINPDRGFPLPTPPFPSSNNFPWVSWHRSCGTDPTHVHRLSRRQPGPCLPPSWSPWWAGGCMVLGMFFQLVCEPKEANGKEKDRRGGGQEWNPSQKRGGGGPQAR